VEARYQLQLYRLLPFVICDRLEMYRLVRLPPISSASFCALAHKIQPTSGVEDEDPHRTFFLMKHKRNVFVSYIDEYLPYLARAKSS